MRVTMTQAMSGTLDGHELPPVGSDVDLPTAIAEALIEQRRAVVAEKAVSAEPTKATGPKPEKAVAKKATTRKG